MQVTPSFAPGAEVFYQTPAEAGARPEVLFKHRFVLDFGEHHHLLASAGGAFSGCNCRQAYLASQRTLGPKS